MSEHELDRGLARTLDRAIEALRDEVPVRPAWRERVLREIEALPAPRRSPLSLTSDLEPAPLEEARRLGSRKLRLAAGLLAGIAAAILVTVGLLVHRDAAFHAPLSTAESPTRTIPSSALPHRSLAAGTEARFSLAAPGAAHVSLVGDFNRWHPGITPLRRAGDGRTWEVQLALPPGRHVYAFVVDGKIVPDPTAPRAADDDFGVPNSVAIIAVSN